MKKIFLKFKKQLLLVIYLSVIIFSGSCSKEFVADNSIRLQENISQDLPILKAGWTLSRPKYNCLDGLGMCNGYLVVCGWQIIKGDISSNHLNSYITVNRVDDKDYLSVYFNESNPTSDTDFEISETMLLNEDVTQALGFDQIYMVKGIYEIDTNSTDSTSFSVLIPILTN